MVASPLGVGSRASLTTVKTTQIASMRADIARTRVAIPEPRVLTRGAL